MLGYPGRWGSLVQLVGRYVIAVIMIPVGVALGFGGLVQEAARRSRRSRPLGL